MTHREKSPGDLIFEALCLRFRSTTNIGNTMTRQELQDATGLTAEALVDALRVLVAPVNEDLPIHFVNHDPNQITIGPAWASRCEDMGKHA
jgi:hypothetical protein